MQTKVQWEIVSKTFLPVPPRVKYDVRKLLLHSQVTPKSTVYRGCRSQYLLYAAFPVNALSEGVLMPVLLVAAEAQARCGSAF